MTCFLFGIPHFPLLSFSRIIWEDILAIAPLEDDQLLYRIQAQELQVTWHLCYNGFMSSLLKCCENSQPYIDGFVHHCSNSSAFAMELLQSCTKSSKSPWPYWRHRVSWIWVDVGSGNGLLPNGTKTLAEPVFISRVLCHSATGNNTGNAHESNHFKT